MLNCLDAQLDQDQMVKFANQEVEHSRYFPKYENVIKFKIQI